MYLSRVAIDISNRRKIKELTHLGAYHSWVENSFPEEIKNNCRSRKLWRIDTIKGQKYLLIVSNQKPDLGYLEKYGVIGSAQTKSYDQFLSMIEERKMYQFRVTLNPVKSIAQKTEKRGKVVPEITIEQQMNFLEVRANSLGFSLLKNEYQIVERSWEPLRKRGEKVLYLSKVTYSGILNVIDKDIFYKTLTLGFGKKKAYGFGLMTVIPV